MEIFIYFGVALFALAGIVATITVFEQHKASNKRLIFFKNFEKTY